MKRVSLGLNTAGILLAGALFGMSSATAQASTYSTAVQADHPLSYFQFGEASGAPGSAINTGVTSTNAGSLGTDGTYQNSNAKVGSGIPTALFPGMTGDNNSIALAGNGSITGSDTGLPTGSAARTVTGWVNFSNDGTHYGDIFSYGTNGTGINPDGEKIFTLVPGQIGDTNTNPNGNGNFGFSQYGDGIGTTAAYNDSTWHFVAFTLTPTDSTHANYVLYVDGAAVVTNAGVAGKPKNMLTQTVGTGTYYLGTDDLNFGYNGQLAQEAVFGTALNAGQISDLYQAALVPEPASVALASFAALGLLVRRRPC